MQSRNGSATSATGSDRVNNGSAGTKRPALKATSGSSSSSESDEESLSPRPGQAQGGDQSQSQAVRTPRSHSIPSSLGVSSSPIIVTFPSIGQPVQQAYKYQNYAAAPGLGGPFKPVKHMGRLIQSNENPKNVTRMVDCVPVYNLPPPLSFPTPILTISPNSVPNTNSNSSTNAPSNTQYTPIRSRPMPEPLRFHSGEDSGLSDVGSSREEAPHPRAQGPPGPRTEVHRSEDDSPNELSNDLLNSFDGLGQLGALALGNQLANMFAPISPPPPEDPDDSQDPASLSGQPMIQGSGSDFSQSNANASWRQAACASPADSSTSSSTQFSFAPQGMPNSLRRQKKRRNLQMAPLSVDSEAINDSPPSNSTMGSQGEGQVTLSPSGLSSNLANQLAAMQMRERQPSTQSNSGAPQNGIASASGNVSVKERPNSYARSRAPTQSELQTSVQVPPIVNVSRPVLIATPLKGMAGSSSSSSNSEPSQTQNQSSNTSGSNNSASVITPRILSKLPPARVLQAQSSGSYPTQTQPQLQSQSQSMSGPSSQMANGRPPLPIQIPTAVARLQGQDSNGLEVSRQVANATSSVGAILGARKATLTQAQAQEQALPNFEASSSLAPPTSHELAPLLGTLRSTQKKAAASSKNSKPVPMRLRPLPSTFFQQPNRLPPVAPGLLAYPLLAPLRDAIEPGSGSGTDEALYLQQQQQYTRTSDRADALMNRLFEQADYANASPNSIPPPQVANAQLPAARDAHDRDRDRYALDRRLERERDEAGSTSSLGTLAANAGSIRTTRARFAGEPAGSSGARGQLPREKHAPSYRRPGTRHHSLHRERAPLVNQSGTSHVAAANATPSSLSNPNSNNSSLANTGNEEQLQAQLQAFASSLGANGPHTLNDITPDELSALLDPLSESAQLCSAEDPYLLEVPGWRVERVAGIHLPNASLGGSFCSSGASANFGSTLSAQVTGPTQFGARGDELASQQLSFATRRTSSDRALPPVQLAHVADNDQLHIYSQMLSAIATNI